MRNPSPQLKQQRKKSIPTTNLLNLLKGGDGVAAIPLSTMPLYYVLFFVGAACLAGVCIGMTLSEFMMPSPKKFASEIDNAVLEESSLIFFEKAMEDGTCPICHGPFPPQVPSSRHSHFPLDALGDPRESVTVKQIGTFHNDDAVLSTHIHDHH